MRRREKLEQMSNAEVVYNPPQEESPVIPQAIQDFCNGKDLRSKSGEAIRISTVDSEGWPHAAMVSAGEVLAIDDKTFRIALWPDSATTQNIVRDGRLTLTFPCGGGLYEFRLQAKVLADQQTRYHLKFFETSIVKAKKHYSKYADVVSGVTVKIHQEEMEKVLERWEEQIAALRTSQAIAAA